MKLFDSHFHIIDPRFPLVANQSYLPPFFTVEEYRKRTESLPIVGGAVVSASFQGFDQSYLIAALEALGSSFVGVTQLPHSVRDDEIQKLHRAKVRGIRFNCKRGGSETIEHLKSFAARVYEIAKWHVELYIDSKDLPALLPTLIQLPAVSIGHLGLSKEGFSNLLFLVENGVKVKASGFGRVDLDVPFALKEIVKVDPSALMFGTDLPSTRASRPFSNQDVALITDLFDESTADQIFYSNAVQFYTG